MMDTSEKVNQFIRDLRSCDYHCRVIIDCNLKLEAVAYRLQGVSSPHAKDVIYENTADPYSNANKWELMEEEEILIRMKQRSYDRIMECEKIETIGDEKMKNLIIDLYVAKMKYDQVAKKYNYSRSTMFDNAKKEISKII